MTTWVHSMSDTRRLSKRTAERDILRAITSLEQGQLDVIDAWLMKHIMVNTWGLTERVQRTLAQFSGSKQDQCWLRGMCFFWGYNVREDEKAAYSQFCLGIALADASGRCHDSVGECLKDGYGVQMDPKMAVKLFQQAAMQGCVSGLVHLAFAHGQGEGVQVNPSEAFRLYSIAQSRGSPDAARTLGRYYQLGSISGRPINIQLAAKYYLEAWNRGEPDSLIHLRTIHETCPSDLIPYGKWRPLNHVHMWTSNAIDAQMKALLLCAKQRESLVFKLPRGILMLICFYVCSLPSLILEQIKLADMMSRIIVSAPRKEKEEDRKEDWKRIKMESNE